MLDMTVVESIRKAFAKRNRVAASCGAVLGGFVPAASYVLVHTEVQRQPALWLLVAGGLAFSAKSVFDFGRKGFGSPLKAAGFTVLVEGVLTFAATPALGYAALGVLVALNAVQTGANLALEHEARVAQKRADARAARVARKNETRKGGEVMHMVR